MKIIILANSRQSYVKPMADGLAQMLLSLGEKPTVFYDGWSFIEDYPSFRFLNVSKTLCKNIVKFLLNKASSKEYKLRPLIQKYSLKKEQLMSSDLIILVAHVPTAFFKKNFAGIETMRQKLKKPIVLYDLVNLVTRGTWINSILKDSPGGGAGLERYDWYLSASVVSEFPMLSNFESFSLIGMDMHDSTLYPEKDKEFLAIIDFAHDGFEKEREIQIQALREANTPYITLDKPMSINEIRGIYRKACLFFLSFRESFGLPIVELQLCGSYICTPYKSWAPSHYVGKSIYEKGEGDLSRNFVVYNNDKETLKIKINHIRSSYNPELVIEEFKTCHPHLYHGDLTELNKFVEKVKNGIITYNSHRSYLRFNAQIITEI